MNIRAVVCGLLMLAGVVPARAFLGDDFRTVAARYGQPVRSLTRADGTQPMVYECEGFRVVVTFEDGRSVSESFSRPDTLSPFSKATLQAFLDAHSAGKSWRETERVFGQRGWQRAGATALYDERSFRPTLVISSVDHAPVALPVSRVLATTPLPEWSAPLEADDGVQGLALGGLELGHLETGHLETGSLQIGSLQTGSLQIGHLGDRCAVR